jgi:hypothetical protein
MRNRSSAHAHVPSDTTSHKLKLTRPPSIHLPISLSYSLALLTGTFITRSPNRQKAELLVGVSQRFIWTSTPSAK